MTSLVPTTTAFAQEDVNEEQDSGAVQVGEGDVVVDPIIHTGVQADVNTNVDTAVVMDEGDCEEANNDLASETSQSSNQQANRDIEAGEGSMYVNPIVQTGVQAGVNTNVDSDTILVEGCQPADSVSSTSEQSSNQQANRDIEGGGGTVLPTYQTEHQITRNTAINADRVIDAPLPE